jgi:hypothetical protein
VKHEQLSQADEIDWALNDPIDDDEVATSDRDGNYSASDSQWESDDESADRDESEGDAPPPVPLHTYLEGVVFVKRIYIILVILENDE